MKKPVCWLLSLLILADSLYVFGVSCLEVYSGSGGATSLFKAWIALSVFVLFYVGLVVHSERD